jgi:hypothetical protein
MPTLCVHGPTWSRCSRCVQRVAQKLSKTLGAQILLSSNSGNRSDRVLQVSHHIIRLLWTFTCDLINDNTLMEQRSVIERLFSPNPASCHGPKHRLADPRPPLWLHVQCALALYRNINGDHGHHNANLLQAVP